MALPDALADALAGVETATRTLVKMPVPEGGETADVTGRVRAVEVSLADWRRAMLSEQGPAKGEEYEIEEVHKAERSYSTAPILASVMAKYPEDTPLTVIQRLLTADAVRLSWRWTQLQRFFGKEGIEMRIAQHEITDDGEADGPHVGQVWTTSTRVVGKKGDKT